MIHGGLEGGDQTLISTLLLGVLFTKANILINQNNHARLADSGPLTIASGSMVTSGTRKRMRRKLLDPIHFDLYGGSPPTKEPGYYAPGVRKGEHVKATPEESIWLFSTPSIISKPPTPATGT